MVGEEKNKLLLHGFPLILLVSIDIPLIFDLILDNVFDNILQRNDSNDFLGGVSASLSWHDLSDNADMGKSLLKVTQQWFQLINVLNRNHVSNDDA
jgi:hypothetical protein